jgi:UDP-N-acetylglucosamine 2-epimerase (non-hydrolysing)
VTIHRPSNVDDLNGLTNIVETVSDVGQRLPVVFPIHPRTTHKLQEFGLLDRLCSNDRVRMTKPLGYVEFLSLMTQARVVLTDSGGVQEETTVLEVPCLTLRSNTERPVTVTQGTNRLVGTDRGSILKEVDEVLNNGKRPSIIPDLWDGRAADRVCRVLEEAFRSSGS